MRKMLRVNLKANCWSYPRAFFSRIRKSVTHHCIIKKLRRVIDKRLARGLSVELESTPFKLYLLVATDVALAFNATSAVEKKNAGYSAIRARIHE
jgi:hypothetical protein